MENITPPEVTPPTPETLQNVPVIDPVDATVPKKNRFGI